MHNFIFYDGKILQRSDASISILSGSAQFGLSPFEGIRLYKNVDNDFNVIELKQHLKRLRKSCRSLGVKFEHSDGEVLDVIHDLVRANRADDDTAFRIVCYTPCEMSWQTIDAEVKLGIFGVNKPYNKIENRKIPHFITSEMVTKPSSTSVPFEVKVGSNYINSRYAHIEAVNKGFDGAILITDNEYISENGGSNICFVRNNTIYSPSVDDNLLNGITLNIINEICINNKIEFRREKIHKNDIYKFDSAFICGSAVEINPIKLNSQVYDDYKFIHWLHNAYINECRSNSSIINMDKI